MKIWIRRIVSIFLVLVLLVTLQRLVMPKYISDVVEGGFTKEYYNETAQHQVLMVGDCELYENFSPITLWKDYGITSYIRGNAQQLIWQTYYLLEDALRYETPEVVVVNALALIYNEPQHEEYNRMTLDGMRWSKEKWKAIQASMMEEENMLDYIFPLLRYHSRITDLSKEDITYLAKDKQRTTAGYYMRVDVAPYEEGAWGDEEEPEEYTFGSNAMSYLDKITKLCKDKGITLLLVKAPSISPIWYDEWEEQIETYASENQLDYINFLELTDEIGIDYTKDTYDEGLHMNLNGAEKCADYLGRFIKEHYDLADMREDEEISKVWKEKTDFYENMKDSQYKELEEFGEIRSY